MAAVYYIGFLSLLAFAQADPLYQVDRPTHAIIEDIRDASSRVVAGWPAEPEQIPYQVSLRMVNGVGSVSSCGGSIIHHNWVLTAAHCLANRITFVVRYGVTNLTRPDIIVETTRKYIYPDYIEIQAGVQTDDIALLGVDQHIPYTQSIQPCRLQSSEQKNINYEGQRLVVSGFGRTDDPWNGGAGSEILMWVFLRGITNAECRHWYDDNSIIQDKTICAGYYNHTSQSSCQGDSGGPLTIVDADGQPTMVGVVSFGHISGCNNEFPAVDGMAAVYFIGLLGLLAFAQAEPLNRADSHAIIEDLRGDTSRIVAGWPAEEQQIPYQISLRMVNEIGSVSSCGGSIIHHNWVLTAAHCVANRITFVIRFGLTNLTRPEYVVETTRKYIYPEYIEIQAGVQTDDIALLGVDQYIPYTRYIQPCRLQSSEQKDINYAGKQLVVSGFGRTDDPWNGGASSEILMWVFLRGITNEECLEWYPGSRVIRERTICAGYYNYTSQSSCQGDSGGPLTIVDADGQPTMVGVVSFGHVRGCNNEIPSGYVRPGYYHDWYYEVTGINFDWKAEDKSSEESDESSSEESEERVNFVDA